MKTALALLLMMTVPFVDCAHDYSSPLILCRHREDSNCYVEDIRERPWAADGAVTAPSPQWEEVGYYIHTDRYGNNTLAFNLSWSNQGHAFSDYVRGYYLTVMAESFDESDMRRIALRDKETMIDELGSENKVVFLYDEYGIVGDVVYPGETYVITLEALPGYHDDTDTRSTQRCIDVPDCVKDAAIRETTNCKKATQFYDVKNGGEGFDYGYDEYAPGYDLIGDVNYATIEETSTQTAGRTFEPRSLFISLVVISAVVVIMICCVIVRSLMRRQHRWSFCLKPNLRTSTIKGSSGRRRVLMLVSEEGGARWWEAASRVASLLQDCGRLSVRFNLWERSAMSDPVQWTAQRFEAADQVVLFWPHTRTLEANSKSMDPFVIGLHICKAHLLKQSIRMAPRNVTFSVVYCDETTRPLDVSEFKQFKLMEQFDLFFRFVSRMSPKQVPLGVKKDLSKSMKLAANKSQASSYKNNEEKQILLLSAIPIVTEG